MDKCILFGFLTILVIAHVTEGGVGQLDQVLDISEADKTRLLKEHNDYRKEALSSMPDLGYDDDLATEALEWARQCNFKHPDHLEVGQNMWMSTADGFPTETWHSEIEDYDYDENKCAADKACGHYTQVVWELAKFIGCGHVKCSTLVGTPGGPTNNAFLWVCNYDVGNVGEGGMFGVPITVYRPFTKDGWTGGYTAAHPDLSGCNDNVAYCGSDKWIKPSACTGNGIYTVNGRQKSAKGFCPDMCNDCSDVGGTTGGSTDPSGKGASTGGSTHGGRGKSSTHGGRGDGATGTDCDDDSRFCGPGKFIPVEDCNVGYTYTVGSKKGKAEDFCPVTCSKEGC